MVQIAVRVNQQKDSGSGGRELTARTPRCSCCSPRPGGFKLRVQITIRLSSTKDFESRAARTLRYSRWRVGRGLSLWTRPASYIDVFPRPEVIYMYCGKEGLGVSPRFRSWVRVENQARTSCHFFMPHGWGINIGENCSWRRGSGG